MPSFAEFFEQATGQPPYGYQARLARDGLPVVLRAPTGAGKTSIILAWLWRRLYGPDPAATPRRLIFALPQRTLVEQVANTAQQWLTNLGLADPAASAHPQPQPGPQPEVDPEVGPVALHVVMGGVTGDSQRWWRMEPHRPAIIVGTVDSLVSKALNRGYGLARAIYPIDFALVTNGAHWVLDEIQLCPESTTTMRQLAAFAGATSRRNAAGSGPAGGSVAGPTATAWPVAEPFGLTCMSATVSTPVLDTVDNPAPDESDVLRIEPEERTGELAVRLGATRIIRRLPVKPGDPRALADAVRERHRPGTLTLVVLNTVATARSLFAALRGGSTPAMLLHSRFRTVEREALVARLLDPSDADEAGRIVVATQVVEAGLDLDAATMITEAPPWPSLVQRAGRVNRSGRISDATLWWLPPARSAPYPERDVAGTVAALDALEGRAVTGEDLLARSPEVPTTEPEVAVLRRPDLRDLFDTAPDLTGADLDISPYVRDADDLDVQLVWADWTPTDSGGRPPADARVPATKWHCRVPLGELRAFARRVDVWRFNQGAEAGDGQWTKVTDGAPARPGEILLVAASAGGYHPETGFDPTARPAEFERPSLDRAPEPATPASGIEDGYRQDTASVAHGTWLSLDQHSADVRDQARALIDAIGPTLPAGVAEDVILAGYVHDAGKLHPLWQEALCRLAPSEQRAEIDAKRPWAKSGIDGRLEYPHGGPFRHELVTLLLLDGPLRPLLNRAHDPDLVRYLALAHHGKLRVQVRGPDDTDPHLLLGLKHGEQVSTPAVLGQPAGTLTVDLEPFTLGGDRSWTRTALELRDRYGPFLLAYLETLVRIADWRASAGLPLAQASAPTKAEAASAVTGLESAR